MKKFIAQVVAFILFTFIILYGVLFVQKVYLNKKANFKIDDSIQFVIIGNSHAETAYNDSLISNFKNFASSGEPYFYSYIKIRNLLAQNANIHTVFVEFTNLNTMKSNDNWIWEKNYMSKRVSEYFPFLSFDDILLLFQKNFFGFLNCQSLAMRKNTIRILNQNFNYQTVIGGYNRIDRNKIDSLINTKQNYIGREFESSKYGLLYLDKIVELCSDYKVEVILIRSPQHKLYPKRCYEKQFNEILKFRYSSVKFMDFNDFELSDKCFGDFEHLNHFGASVYSKWFEENIILKRLR